MCWIVGVVGKAEGAPVLVNCLLRLEYRGYDSCGVATVNSGGIEVRKAVGPVAEVTYQQGLAMLHGTLGIGHTRWATHGGVSRENTHPHLSCDGTFALVHNGIISNYQILKSELKSRGHRFLSETGVVIVFSFDRVSGSFDEEVHLPKTSPWVAPFLHLLAGQLLAFETASVLGRDIDRPRSLAKSVTVA